MHTSPSQRFALGPSLSPLRAETGFSPAPARAIEAGMIEVMRKGGTEPLAFEVVVREGSGESRHHVTMARALCERLAGSAHAPEACVEAAFRFLLEREPKESILARFDVSVIRRYFPEFERELPRYLGKAG